MTENIKALRYWPLWGDSPRKGPVTRKIFPFDDVIMQILFAKDRECLWSLTVMVVLQEFLTKCPPLKLITLGSINDKSWSVYAIARLRTQHKPLPERNSSMTQYSDTGTQWVKKWFQTMYDNIQAGLHQQHMETSWMGVTKSISPVPLFSQFVKCRRSSFPKQRN